MLRDNGGDCYACQKRGGPTMDIDDATNNGVCICEVCKCVCEILFPRSKRNHDAAEYLRKRQQLQQQQATTVPTDTPSYFNSVIVDTITNNTIDAAQEQGRVVDNNGGMHDNVLLGTASDLFSDVGGIQGNIRLRHRMSQAMPITNTTREGLSIAIAQLCTGITRDDRFSHNRLSSRPLQHRNNAPPTEALPIDNSIMEVWTNSPNQNGGNTSTEGNLAPVVATATGTSTTTAAAAAVAATHTTTTTPAILTPTGVVSRSIATNNSTSVLRARNLDRRPPLAVAVAHALVQLFQYYLLLPPIATRKMG